MGEWGIHVKCSDCGYKTRFRLKRGTSLRAVFCLGCKKITKFVRDSEYDRWVKGKEVSS